MERHQQQPSAEASFPPRRPDGSVGPPLSRTSGRSRGFIRSLKEQWQIPGMAEVFRREDPASSVLPHQGQTHTAQDYSKCSVNQHQPASWSHPQKVPLYDSSSRVYAGLCGSGSGWAPSCGSLDTFCSSASQFSDASSARSVDILFCKQRIPIPRWACCGGRRSTVGSSTTSSSAGCGSSVRSPSARDHLSHNSDAAPAGVLSYGASEKGVPSLRATLRHTVAYVDSQRRGASAVPYGQTPIGTFQRSVISPPSAFVQAPATQPLSGSSVGPRTNPTSTVTPTGVPVTLHFDPHRSSPFELSKFDRRDPYVHFYIPVDCPLARRCWDGVCPLAHTKLEKIFHPIVYKTQRCQMALADSGRCPYINKCAFFHTEEDRREAELRWKAWEAEWACWRQQIDELLRRHHKLEEDIRRKVEGIIKIRMPRSSPSDLLGRWLANLGVLAGFGEQKKSSVQQSSKGMGPVGLGLGSVSFSSPRGRSFAEAGLGGEAMAGVADTGRTPSASRLEQSVGLCGLTEAPVFGIQATSAVIGNTRRFVEHSEDRSSAVGREWLYIANSWNKQVAQQCRQSGGFISRVETSTISTRSTVHETLAPVTKDSKAFHSSSTRMPAQEARSGHDSKASLAREHTFIHGVFGQRAAHYGSRHDSPHTSYGCSSAGSPTDHGAVPLRTAEASVRSVTTAKVETENRVISTVITSQTQQTVAISAPVDCTSLPRMSTSETTIQGGASKHSSPHDGLVCKPLRFVRPSEASENVGKSAVVETQVSGKAAAKSECCVAGETTGGTRVPEQPSCLVIQTPSSCNENSGCEGEQGGTVSSEGSSRSSITGCPSQAGSEPYPLRPSVEGQDDRQDVAWTTVVTEAPKETGQAGVINSGSDGATNPHQQPCSWAYGESVGGLGGVQIGQMSCPSNPFESQESRRVAEEDESILEVASAPQTIAIQRSTSLMDAPPSCILQDDSVSQVEPLRSITSQESSTAPANCTPTARSSADEEGSAIDSTGCSNKSSTVPANLGEGALAEMHGDLSARILPPLPNRNGENSEVEAVDIQPKPVAADAVQGTVEEQALGQTWNRATSTEGATACTPLQDASERDAFSETIDTGMCRTEAPAGQGSCATVSQDELNFLARKLTDLLRTAAEEIRLLNIGSLADLTRSDEHGQNRNPAVGEPALTTSGGVDSYSVPVSGNDQDAESLPSSRASSADTERQAVPAALPGSQTPHHPPD